MAVEGPTKAGLAALTRAQAYIGVREQPPGSNRGKLIDLWNERAGVPVGSSYCCAFVHSNFSEVGVEVDGDGSKGDDDAYVPSMYSECSAKGMARSRPYRGYVVCFDWNQDGILDHTGHIEKVLALRWAGSRFVGLLRTVEANTGSGLSGSQSDGDGVYRRWRWVNSSTRFLRVG